MPHHLVTLWAPYVTKLLTLLKVLVHLLLKNIPGPLSNILTYSHITHFVENVFDANIN